MCGRFVLFSETLSADVAQWPGIERVDAPAGLPPARYNIAPTQPVATIRVAETFASIEPAHWGLIPHWKKDIDGPPLFNARAETVASKPSFRDAFKKGRCIIPLDGYYEWHDDGTGKKPYYVTGPEGMLWAAGLWAETTLADGSFVYSCTMVTTAATEEMAWLHGRLPKFLSIEEIPAWLDPDNREPQLLEPTTLRGFHTRIAATEVGNVRNDYPGLIAT